MAVKEEKLQRFEQAIFSEVAAQAAEILGELDAYKAERIEKAADEELEKSYQLIQSRIGEFRAAFSRKVTQEKLSARQRLLRYRQEQVDALFERAGERLKAYTASADYRRWIQSAAEPYAELLKDGVLLVRAEDKALFEELFPGVMVETDGKNRLGGFAILNQRLGQYADETFAARLEAEKERFYQSGGLGLDIADPAQDA